MDKTISRGKRATESAQQLARSSTRLRCSLGVCFVRNRTTKRVSVRCVSDAANGMLTVVKPVRTRGANAEISMNPGMSFGPDVMTMGLNVYENYRKYCHAEQSPCSSSK